MTAAILDRDRLAKLLGMLGSVHDGEVVAAARQAERLRADAGLTWAEIVIPRMPPPQYGQFVRSARDLIGFVIEHQYLLNERERQFIASIRRWRGDLSEKQTDWLSAIVAKCQRAGSRAA